MEEYYTDNLLPLLEGEDLKNSDSSNPDSSPPTSTPKDRDLTTLRRSKRLQALHQLHYVQSLEQNILMKCPYSGTGFKQKLNILNQE